MLTEQEKALAADAGIMLTKNRIIESVYELFGKLAETYKMHAASLPVEITQLHPKISRGENYLGMPWVMLDYPRLFTGKNAVAVRTMFWWGHYFSLHLLLQGNKMQLLDFEKLTDTSGWYFSLEATPWQHRFDEQLAVPATKVTQALYEKQLKNGFYKMSTYLPLQHWDEATFFLTEKFGEAVQFIKPGMVQS